MFMETLPDGSKITRDLKEEEEVNNSFLVMMWTINNLIVHSNKERKSTGSDLDWSISS